MTRIRKRARRTDPETSAPAGDETRDRRMRDLILECHLEWPAGLTEWELEGVFALKWGSLYPGHNLASMRSTLKDLGLVMWNKMHRVNPETNKRQRVWVVNPNPTPPPLYICSGCNQKCPADAPMAVLQPTPSPPCSDGSTS